MNKTENAGEITADMTINEIITQHPETVAVFNRHKIDSCCGGGLPLAEVARKPTAHRYSASKGIPGLRRAQAG